MSQTIALTPISNSQKPGWLERHQQKLTEIQLRAANIRWVFIGDSIIQHWETLATDSWHQLATTFNALNLGFAGDRTEHLLWRIEHGQLEGYTAEGVILLIGTNNSGHRKDPAPITAEAIQVIIKQIREKQPNARIIVHALLPRGKRPTNPLRCLNNAINHQVRQLTASLQVEWFDAAELFINEQGLMKNQVMDDYLHPNPSVYKVWEKTLCPLLQAK